MNRFLMIACTLTVAIATVAASAIHVAPIVEKIDYPRYAYNYAVNDPLSKDNKAQWETRDGNAVRGSYSLVEPDGSLRVVDYMADDHIGFNALVKNIGPAIHSPLIAKTVAPLTTIAGPVSYGFGPTPIISNLPKLTSLGQWSLPWDPITHSYGGWVPLANPLIKTPSVTIFSKKYVNGNLHKWITGPLPLLYGKTLVVEKRH